MNHHYMLMNRQAYYCFICLFVYLNYSQPQFQNVYHVLSTYIL